MSSLRRTALLLGMTAVAAPSLAIAADPPAGLVEAITGETTPALSEMSEIPPNTPIRLGSGASLTFLHYLRCRYVTVTGGTVTLSRNDYSVDGHIDNEKPGPCPLVHQLGGSSSGATSGGIVVRGLTATTPLPVKPSIVFVGGRAGEVVGASIMLENDDQHPVVSLALTPHHATMPASSPPLTPNRRFVLRVTLSQPPSPLDMAFVARAESTTDSLVVLRVD